MVEKVMFEDKSNTRAEEKTPYASNGTEKFIPCSPSNYDIYCLQFLR